VLADRLLGGTPGASASPDFRSGHNKIMETADELRRVLGPFGIWMPPPARAGRDAQEYGREIEAAGFTSVWFPGMNSVADLIAELPEEETRSNLT
jgi:hypothetical protein